MNLAITCNKTTTCVMSFAGKKKFHDNEHESKFLGLSIGTYESFITFLNRVQKSEKGFAALNIYQTNEGVYSIQRSHKDNNYYSLLFLWIFPIEKMLR